MVIQLSPELESAVNKLAKQQGVTPEVLVADALRARFLPLSHRIQPRDDWERKLLEAATDCGVSLSNESLSSEGLYE